MQIGAIIMGVIGFVFLFGGAFFGLLKMKGKEDPKED